MKAANDDIYAEHNTQSTTPFSVVPSNVPACAVLEKALWRHQMETFSALLAFCAGNSPVTGEFPAQWPVTRSFDAFFNLRLNKPSSKQSWGWWFETPSHSLWCHCNDYQLCHLTHRFVRFLTKIYSNVHSQKIIVKCKECFSLSIPLKQRIYLGIEEYLFREFRNGVAGGGHCSTRIQPAQMHWVLKHTHRLIN